MKRSHLSSELHFFLRRLVWRTWKMSGILLFLPRFANFSSHNLSSRAWRTFVQWLLTHLLQLGINARSSNSKKMVLDVPLSIHYSLGRIVLEIKGTRVTSKAEGWNRFLRSLYKHFFRSSTFYFSTSYCLEHRVHIEQGEMIVRAEWKHLALLALHTRRAMLAINVVFYFCDKENNIMHLHKKRIFWNLQCRAA